MKKLFVLVLLLTVSLAAVVWAQTRTSNRASGRGPAWGSPPSVSNLVTGNLVSEWRFDEGSGDILTDYRSSNNGQLGSAAGADANDPDWVTAGLDFPSTGDRVEISGLTFDPSAGAWSISVVGRYDTASGIDRSAWSQQDGTGTGRSILTIDSTTDSPCTFIGGSGEQCGSQTLSTGYHHLTITHNGSGTISWYVDGGAAATASITPEAANGAHWIGSNKAGVGEFSDPIAWALYYNDALTEAENNSNCKALDSTLAGSRGVTLTCQ